MYYRQVKFLAQNRVVDAVVCIIPANLYETVIKDEPERVETNLEEEEEQQNDILEANFRRALKAKTMHLGKPIQLMRDLSLESNPKTQQDDATKAWNFCTALYYKANQTVPWKLITNVNRPSVCFVGIGFYRSRDRRTLRTSLAQIFDELGNGVILRGTPIQIPKDDRIPHLTEEQAYQLLSRALSEYEIALDTSPARLVIHKSSKFNGAELEGFRQATKEMRVNTVDFVTILDTKLRLLREGIYPPYRGTHIEIDNTTHLLYTRGAVKYYRTYTGKYIPQPLEIRIVESDESPGQICKEILGLTKMNWNNTQFDGKYPITIECARKVGQIMKYVDENEKPQIRYSFYM
jgi:argonaute-like protein implicated in RNA metabolism and viral defense